MKNIKLFFYWYFFILIILFFIGLFFDFQISQAVAKLDASKYYSTNVFAVGIEIFGELPFYLLISFCFVVFCVGCGEKVKSVMLKIPLQILLFLCSSSVLFLALLRTTKFAQNYISISVDTLTFVAIATISILINLLMFLFIKKINFSTLKKLIKFSFMIVAVSIISIIFVQIIKNNLCVRARFRTINFLVNDALYRPCWNLVDNLSLTNLYLPNDAFESFPSGHTMTASIFLCFVFVPSIFKIPANTKFLYWLGPVSFIFIVALGRIVGGAHFLTDVTFSAIFVGILYLIFFSVIFKKKKVI